MPRSRADVTLRVARCGVVTNVGDGPALSRVQRQAVRSLARVIMATLMWIVLGNDCECTLAGGLVRRGRLRCLELRDQRRLPKIPHHGLRLEFGVAATRDAGTLQARQQDV